MQLVSLQMREIVAINGIFSLKWRHYYPKGDILDYWGMTIFLLIILLYPIKERIKVYTVETMDMGRLRWNNGVSGKWNPIKYCGIYFTGWGYFGRNHTVLNVGTLQTHWWHIKPYVELCTICSKTSVLCLMASYHIN